MWKVTLTQAKPQITFNNIPAGTSYAITEVAYEFYECTDIAVTGDLTASPQAATGTVTGGVTKAASVIVNYTNQYYGPIFPETGGLGAKPLMIGGVTMLSMFAIGTVIYRFQKRRKYLQ